MGRRAGFGHVAARPQPAHDRRPSSVRHAPGIPGRRGSSPSLRHSEAPPTHSSPRPMERTMAPPAGARRQIGRVCQSSSAAPRHWYRDDRHAAVTRRRGSRSRPRRSASRRQMERFNKELGDNGLGHGGGRATQINHLDVRLAPAQACLPNGCVSPFGSGTSTASRSVCVSISQGVWSVQQIVQTVRERHGRPSQVLPKLSSLVISRHQLAENRRPVLMTYPGRAKTIVDKRSLNSAACHRGLGPQVRREAYGYCLEASGRERMAEAE